MNEQQKKRRDGAEQNTGNAEKTAARPERERNAERAMQGGRPPRDRRFKRDDDLRKRQGEAAAADGSHNADRSKRRQEDNSRPSSPKNGQNAQNGQKGQNAQNKQNKQNRKQQQNKGNAKNQNRSAEDSRKDTYVYELDGNLYINLTNKCSNGCEFCVRNERASYYGNYLWLRHGDPDAEKVISVLSQKDLSAYNELVFCGFGEPTYKLAEMIAVAEYAHEKGLKTRLNTNGQANLIHKRDVVPDLKGKIDLVNVSLNAPDAESYQKICHSMFRLDAFPALVDFAKSCVKNGVACRFSVVDCIGEEAVAACKRLSETEGVPLYVRKYIADS